MKARLYRAEQHRGGTGKHIQKIQTVYNTLTNVVFGRHYSHSKSMPRLTDTEKDYARYQVIIGTEISIGSKW